MQGIRRADRALLWPFLLGVFGPDSTYEDRSAERQRLQNIYARLVFVCEEIDTEIRLIKGGTYHRINGSTKATDHAMPSDSGAYLTSSTRLRDIPSSCESSPDKEQAHKLKGYSPRLSGSHASFADAHRVIVMDAMRTDMKPIHELSSFASRLYIHPMKECTLGNASGALVPNSNVLPVSSCEGMPELMLLDTPELNPSQAIASGKQPIWKSAIAMQMIDGSDHLSRVDKKMMARLINILSAYAVHDPENGYCQGMSDLAVVFIGLEQDNAVAFACFEKFMRAARQNFRHDEEGIRNQLKEISNIIENTDPKLFSKIASLGDENCMFAYRMVVVLMRRELPLEDVLTLWEISWAYSMEEFVCKHEPLSHNVRTISLKGVESHSTRLHEIDFTIKNPDLLMKSDCAGDILSRASSGELASRKCTKQGSNSSVWMGSPGFVLQFVAAVIKSKRHLILDECEKPDDLMRLFNKPDIDFWSVVAQARKQYKAYRQGLQVIQRLSKR